MRGNYFNRSANTLMICTLNERSRPCADQLFFGETCYASEDDSICFPTLKPCTSQKPSSGDDWQCVDGVWTSTGSVQSPSIIIFSSVVVIGNFNVSSVTMNGLGSTITVSGCSSLPKEITIILTPKDYENLKNGKKILSDLIRSGCPFDSTRMTTSIIVKSSNKKKCEKFKSGAVVRGSLLQGSFQLDNSACNRWWIAVVAVIGALILVAIILTLIFALHPKARACICPTRSKLSSR